MSYVIGIDIGGTNLRIGTVSEFGELQNFELKSSAPLISDNAGDNLFDEINSYIDKNNLLGNIAAVSIGVPSMVSRDKSFIFSTPNLKGLENLDLGHILEKKLNIPVFVDRDVNYLLINDIKKFNLDPEKQNTILGFYLGTGFGNAVYINGQLHVGKNGAAGELGHIPLYGVNEQCTCGNIGCSETKCSGRHLKELVSKYFPDTDISDVFTKHNDDSIIKDFISTLAVPMCAEINILDPDYIVLAGGVMIMKDFPMDYLVERIHFYSRKPYPADNLQFIYPEHTQNSGVIGGAYAAFEKLNAYK